MANNINLWDKVTSIPIMGGKVLDAESLYIKYPHISPESGVVLEWLGGVCGAIDSLDILRSIYTIDPALDDENALAAILHAKANHPKPDTAELASWDALAQAYREGVDSIDQ